ncbi:DNA-binding IclR family transcriptional regulator [Mycobacterium frederiksbergense]|uniref:DNA-binding IclR family transcriptional regulator n=1 Tax=Mycolicibacterium frederiksbergense TaxID=117567 RepID=A0ABT6L9N2_9MYCO|nr:DNA-binding IclR family transcriptional regulator [Mycolicibacterium frederiksbergense]
MLVERGFSRLTSVLLGPRMLRRVATNDRLLHTSDITKTLGVSRATVYRYLAGEASVAA